MGDVLALCTSLLAFGVSLALSAWCLGRAARSVPTILLSLILLCVAVWNGFEYLWLRHGLRTYQHLGFIGATLAPCLFFHYAISLSPRHRVHRPLLTMVYSGTTFFLVTNLGGFASSLLQEFFWTPGYNVAFIAFFAPAGVAALALLEAGRRRAPDAGTKSLFTYPLAAGLVLVPLGFAELAIPAGVPIPRTASAGALVAAIILAVGVLRHRRTYDAMAVLRKDAASVLQATEQGLLHVEPDGRILFSNGVARELLGGHPRTLEEAGLEVPAQGRVLVRRADRILETRYVRSTDVLSGGRFSLLLQDKTADLEMLQTLASKEALASLGQAAATLAHEIRNPLTAVQAALDCLTEDVLARRPPESRHLELMRAELRRLNELLARSLELGRPLTLERELCDLNALLQATFRRVPAPQGVRVSSNLDPALPRVPGDAELLVQALSNLLKNAFEASPDVRVSTGRENGAVLVRIGSEGARIPPEVLPRLFEPFVTSKPKGTGLGLAFTRKIATAHSGTVEGRNTETGVVFEVRLPT